MSEPSTTPVTVTVEPSSRPSAVFSPVPHSLFVTVNDLDATDPAVGEADGDGDDDGDGDGDGESVGLPFPSSPSPGPSAVHPASRLPPATPTIWSRVRRFTGRRRAGTEKSLLPGQTTL